MFVVEHFASVAALDEDRPGAYARTVDVAGEERAEELWEDFGDSLDDDKGYRTVLLARVSNLEHSPDDN